MTDAPTPQEDSAEARTLQMERVFAAPPERVFNAWTDPTILARWWGHGSYNVSSVDLDPREGGAWAIVLVNAEGVAFQVSGVYREVVPPSRLVFTWAWTHEGVRGHETVVTIDLTPDPGGTRLRLHQAVFAESAHARRHNEGWDNVLAGLDAFIAAGHLS